MQCQGRAMMLCLVHCDCAFFSSLQTVRNVEIMSKPARVFRIADHLPIWAVRRKNNSIDALLTLTGTPYGEVVIGISERLEALSIPRILPHGCQTAERAISGSVLPEGWAPQ